MILTRFWSCDACSIAVVLKFRFSNLEQFEQWRHEEQEKVYATYARTETTNMNKDDIHFPLTAAQKISMMRNIEQMLHTALGSAGEVRDLLRTLVRGRYDTEYNHSLSESGRT